MNRAAAALLLLLAVAAAGAAPPLPPHALRSGGDPECWADGGCARGYSVDHCFSEVGDVAGVAEVPIAWRVEVGGRGACALWVWEATGRPLGVWWDGVFRGAVGDDGCLELYTPPGYTMDGSNITITCATPRLGCSVYYAMNPPGTACNADGTLTLSAAARALVAVCSLCCLTCAAAAAWHLCARRRRAEYVAVSAPASWCPPPPYPAVPAGEHTAIVIGVPQSPPPCAAAPTPPPRAD